MKRNNTAIITGAILILIGLFIVGRAVGIVPFSLFFDGWWTVFIIVPCLVGIVNANGNRTPFIIGLGIGILLLCCAQDWISWGMFAPTLIAVILVIIGLNLIIGEPFRKKMDEFCGTNRYQNNGNQNQYNNGQGQPGQPGRGGFAGGQGGQGGTAGANGGAGFAAGQNNANQTAYTYNPNTNTYDTNDVNMSNSDGNNGNNANFNRGSAYSGADKNRGTCVCTAVLSSREIRYDGEVFRGAMLSACLGAVELDLRNAIISGQVTVEVKSVLGGVDILMPNYVRTVVNGTPVLGGIENNTRTPAGANELTPTVIINGSCILGGIEVK